MGRQGDQRMCEEGGSKDGRFGLYCVYKGCVYFLIFGSEIYTQGLGWVRLFRLELW
jgi:hypothetical protein